MHRRCGKAQRAAHETLHACLEMDGFALHCLEVLFADFLLHGGAMPFGGAPPIGEETANATRLQQRWQLQKAPVLPSPTDGGSHGPAAVITGMPEPPRLRFRAHITPPRSEL